MMKYEEGEKLADTRPCAAIRADLKMCLLSSDCCKKDKKTPRECLSVTDGSVPNECQVLRRTFFECKRSLLSELCVRHRGLVVSERRRFSQIKCLGGALSGIIWITDFVLREEKDIKYKYYSCRKYKSKNVNTISNKFI